MTTPMDSAELKGFDPERTARLLRALAHDCENTDGWEDAAPDLHARDSADAPKASSWTTSNPMSDEMRGLVERLKGLTIAANEPPPKPPPEQTSRAAEAMAGVEDQHRSERWRDRIREAHRNLAELAPEAATAIETLSERIAVLRDGLDAICAMLAGHAGQPTHLGDVYKIADAARATPQQENQP